MYRLSCMVLFITLLFITTEFVQVLSIQIKATEHHFPMLTEGFVLRCTRCLKLI